MLEVLELSAKVVYGSSPAMAVLGTTIPRFVCLDINMPGVDGTEFSHTFAVNDVS